jgi:hypothetical protein
LSMIVTCQLLLWIQAIPIKNWPIICRKTADIKNAYLTAPGLEMRSCVLGPEFGANAGKHAIVVWSLYGLKWAGASFWNHLADCMQHLGWDSCIADEDLWMKAEIRPNNGHKHYAYALLYMDDMCVAHNDAELCLLEGWQVFQDEARYNWWPRFLSRSQVEDEKAIEQCIRLEHEFQQVYPSGCLKC